MQSQRQLKYARQIQKDLGEIFQKDPRYFFGNSLVTVTQVEVSPDLSFIKLYMSVFPIKDAEEVFFRLNENKSEVRKLLGNKIGKRARIVPEIAFFHDDTEEKASHLDKLISGLNIPPASSEETKEGDT